VKATESAFGISMNFCGLRSVSERVYFGGADESKISFRVE